jgi:hypothetical protein
MSIVGPRPERAYFIGRIEKELPDFHLRLRTKPGITGLAQVQLGYTNTDEGLRQKLHLDLEYIPFARILDRPQDPLAHRFCRADRTRRLLALLTSAVPPVPAVPAARLACNLLFRRHLGVFPWLFRLRSLRVGSACSARVHR